MWVLADVVGLFSINVGPFSPNVGRRQRIFSAKLGPKSRCYRAGPVMFSNGSIVQTRRRLREADQMSGR